MSKKKGKSKGARKGQPGADTLKRRAEHQQRAAKGYQARLTAAEKHYVKTGEEKVSLKERQAREKEVEEAWVIQLMVQEPGRPTKRKGTSGQGAYFWDSKGPRRPFKRKK